ncbi:MAG: hypothetical protein SGARI_001516 [Bacillariaceae sp.]
MTETIKSHSKKSVLAQPHPPAFSFDTRTVRHGGTNAASSSNDFTDDQIESWITKCASCLLKYETKWKGEQSLSYHFGPNVISETSKTHDIPVASLKKAIMEQGRWPHVVQAALRMKNDNDRVALASSASTKGRLNKKRALNANEDRNVRPAKKSYRVLGGLLNKMSSGQLLEGTTAPSNRKIVPKKNTAQQKSIPRASDSADQERTTGAVASQSRSSVLPMNDQRAEESTGGFQMRPKDNRVPKKRFIARMQEEESETESMTEGATPAMDSYLPMSPIVGRGRKRAQYLPIMSPETIRDPEMAPSTQGKMAPLARTQFNPAGAIPNNYNAGIYSHEGGLRFNEPRAPGRHLHHSYKKSKRPPAKGMAKLPLTENTQNAVACGKPSAQDVGGKPKQALGKNKKNDSSKTAEATALALSTKGGHIDYFDELFG